MSNINQTRYVRITSSVTGADSVAQQSLAGRVFTPNARVPLDSILQFSNAADVASYFGAGSDEAAFAAQYFGYISPAPASSAQSLQFALAATSPVAPAILGGTHSPFATIKAVTNGALKLTVSGTVVTVSALNLSSASSLADVATLVTAAITAANGAVPIATVTYSPTRDTFSINGNTAGTGATLTISTSAGVDLAPMLGWVGSGSISIPSTLAQTFLEAFQAAESASDSFGSAVFLSMAANPTTPEAVALANYVSSKNVKYQLYIPFNDTANSAETVSATFIGNASVGLVLEPFLASQQYVSALPMAILAATDYQRRSAAVNYMYRQAGTTLTPGITSDAQANRMDNLRVNYYGRTASAGQLISFFQRGVLCGPATAPVDMSVHGNEQWLKAYLSSRLLSLLIGVGRIPANADGRAMVLSIVQGGVDQALVNGTIIAGKTLTPTQKVAITQATGDDLAWQDVQTQGYWKNAQVVQDTGGSGVTDYTLKYTLFYSKGDSIRKIEGSHNLV